MDRQQTQAVYDAAARWWRGVRGADALAAFHKRDGVKVWSLLGIREMVGYLAEVGEPVSVAGVKRPLEQAEVRGWKSIWPCTAGKQ